MRNLSRWGLSLFFLVVSLHPLWAKDKNTVAILPFSINSIEDIEYIGQGIGDMLSSRISVSGHIDLIDKDLVFAALSQKAVRETNLTDVQDLGEKLKADFVIWGSVTKIGNNLSIDGKLLDIALRKTPVNIFAQCSSMDEVIPKINEFAEKIDTYILGGPSQANEAPPVKKEVIVSSRPSPQANREAEIISGMRSGKRGTYTSSINPDFINAVQPLDRKTFWKSQQFSNEFRGMDIGDINGDGLNETVIIDTHNIMIYRKKGNEFKLIQHIPGKSYDNYISLDVADINENGIKEIIVSNYKGQQVHSFVIEYRNGGFETIASALPFFMRVINNASGIPLLLGQRKGMDKPFDTPIYEIKWQNGTYLEGQKMRIPQGLSLYGLTLDKLGSSSEERIIALDEYDHICIFEKTDKALSRVTVMGGSDEFIWKSEGVFGGSNTVIESMKNEHSDADSPYHNINLRILTYDTNGDGKREIIIVKNLSSANRLFQRIKLFTAAEVYDLEWDGIGFVENWRTKKISGYVADYQFRDIDNDGENEVVLALVLSVGGSIRERSVVVAYKLNG